MPCETRVPTASGGASSDKGGGSASSTDVGNDKTHQPPRYPIRARTKPWYLNEYVTSKVVDEVVKYAVEYATKCLICHPRIPKQHIVLRKMNSTRP